MIRIGRYTAALAMTAIGVILVLDHAGSVDAMAVLRVWWPLIVVAFGLELLIVQAIFRKEGTRVRLAIGGMFGAAVLTGFVLVASQGSEFQLSWLQKWTDGVSWGIFDSEHAQHSFDKGVKVVPFTEADTVVAISDMNGKVVLKQGPVTDIEVQSIVYVDVSDATKAEEISRQSVVQVDHNGQRIEIAAHGQPYGVANMRKSGMDLTVTFPQGRVPSSVEVNIGSGSIRLDQWPEANELVLDVKNGDISGDQIGAKLRAKVLNGDVKLSQLLGSATVETVNGDIELKDVRAAVFAKTVNGDIRVESPVVGGSWNVSSTVGDLKLAWPEGAGVNVKATNTFGGIQSDWPLSVGTHEAGGKLGDGTWDIIADTTADISLQHCNVLKVDRGVSSIDKGDNRNVK